MDDMSTKDFRHLVDFFNNSDWNPTIGDIDRYSDKTTPALFVVDPFLPDGDSNPHFTVCNVIGNHNLVTEVNIAAMIDGKHRCQHVRCNELSWPINLFCPMSLKRHAFLLGPLILGLPWIGRNAIHADVHGGSARGAFTNSRGSMSYARFNHGVMLGYKGIVVDQFHHGRRDSRLRCVMQQDSPIALTCFWNDLKAGKEKIKNQHEYNQQISFADAPSPYNDKPMLFEFASIMFKNLVKLL
ncbi:hypothetical protein QSH57_015632 [Fusarium oxysporum f. sp. vasinfectum]|nr:hypothetical protein QSH57_015632 [Fusarium oxysporum f. sp. vasinfectum]